MKSLTIILAVFTLAATVPLLQGPGTATTENDWPTYAHDWTRRGYTSASVPNGLEHIWSFYVDNDMRGKVRNEVRSSPVVSGGKVFFTDHGGWVYALDAETGDLIWRYKTSPVAGLYAGPTPTVVDGVVYVGSWEGRENFTWENPENAARTSSYLYAIDADNGELIWRFDATSERDSGIDGAPVVINNRVYFGSWNGYVYCLNTENGDLIWSYSDGNGKMGHVIASLTVVDGVIYFGTGAGSGSMKRDNYDYMGWVYALNADNGSLVWDYPIGDELSGVTVVDNVVYVGSGWFELANGLYALDAKTGELLWRYETERRVEAQAAIYDNKVYFIDDSGTLRAVDARTGELFWSASVYPGGGTSPPSIADGKIYVGGYGLYVFDAASGELIEVYWASDIVWSSTAIAYNKVYFTDRDGRDSALRVYGENETRALGGLVEGQRVAGTVELKEEFVGARVEDVGIILLKRDRLRQWAQFGEIREATVSSESIGGKYRNTWSYTLDTKTVPDGDFRVNVIILYKGNIEDYLMLSGVYTSRSVVIYVDNLGETLKLAALVAIVACAVAGTIILTKKHHSRPA